MGFVALGIAAVAALMGGAAHAEGAEQIGATAMQSAAIASNGAVLQMVTHGLSLAWFEGRLVMGGRTELLALGMSSRLSTLKPMGSYRITLTGGSAPVLELSTIEGSMQLSGTGRWVGPRLRFEGVASAAPEHEAALANLLNIIGRRNGARSIITLG